jgi:16S rRNA processing protein RimM
MNQPSDTLIHIATLGKTVGLKGDMKLHITSDFPEQFVSGAEFYLEGNRSVRLSNVNLSRGTVKIEGFDTPEDAKRLTNQKLYTTFEATREQCELEEGEFFWFDIIGCKVIEDGYELGVVKDIDRLGATDYLLITTDNHLVAQGHAKSFLLPYQPPFIAETNVERKQIEVIGGLDILKAS